MPMRIVRCSCSSQPGPSGLDSAASSTDCWGPATTHCPERHQLLNLLYSLTSSYSCWQLRWIAALDSLLMDRYSYRAMLVPVLVAVAVAAAVAVAVAITVSVVVNAPQRCGVAVAPAPSPSINMTGVSSSCSVCCVLRVGIWER
ncbi:hypothetical protein B0T26DRAFT_712260 [Lasiosphaeria miniovina]|uniref:Uncharacterized protein n=1 Tax=Lasiosphaeria miniovina TaxID=1954250 RepID=A0AA40ALR8_9PEZI|nr:uncharacterized protein B0T26DRAFT_712260 [Lasiosphaeria miniovina]KAK0718193.1 hypothetical protein B0T26DRAFT_712260 [Lasiosphaeria miniovina]